jgi:predicted pyridoxine 5'-phosphate oxidase superfamily flavin-nucleotide-binding protein
VEQAKMKLTNEQLDFIKNNNVMYFATASGAGAPRVIPVMPSLVESGMIVLSDMQMSVSAKNAKENKNVFLYLIDSNMNRNLKISGVAEYAAAGELFDKVVKLEAERCPELTPRGIIIINIENIVEGFEE